MGGADIPVVWDGLDDGSNQTILPSLEWATYKNFYTDDDSDYADDASDDEMFWTGELEQDLSGHLRKEIHSRSTQRMLRQSQRFKAKKASGCKASAYKDAGSSKVNVNRTLF